MPLFGEYQTQEKPLFTRLRHGQTRAYWRARRRGMDDNCDYFIKSIAMPDPGAAHESRARGLPAMDPSADFFEAIERLKQTQPAHPHLIASIHASGRTGTEVWYATDYYLRRSLAQFYSTSTDITDEGLGHVVFSLASACLALQRSSGLSHGNLKPSNVLVAGKPAPLRLTQLHLIDAAGPASLRHGFEKRPDPTQPETRGLCESPNASAGNGGLALGETAELRDLGGIGRVLLQLVESNPIEGPDDYRLPIEFSAPWRALGEHSQRWLHLCNLLLDPNLSLRDISLESLAKDFQPSPRRSGTTPWISGLGVVLLAGTSYGLWTQPWKHATKVRKPAEAIASARPPAPSAIDESADVPQAARPSVATTPDSTSNTAAPPAIVEAPLPASAVDLASTSGEVGPKTGEADRVEPVPQQTAVADTAKVTNDTGPAAATPAPVAPTQAPTAPNETPTAPTPASTTPSQAPAAPTPVPPPSTPASAAPDKLVDVPQADGRTVAMPPDGNNNTAAPPAIVEGPLPASAVEVASTTGEVGPKTGETDRVQPVPQPTAASNEAFSTDRSGAAAAATVAPAAPHLEAPAPSSTERVEISETPPSHSEVPRTLAPAPLPTPAYAAIAPAFSITNSRASSTPDTVDSQRENTDSVSRDTNATGELANSESASTGPPHVRSKTKALTAWASRSFLDKSFWDTVISQPKRMLARVKQRFTPGEKARVDSAELDEQLHNLEVEVSRAVALPRGSPLFASVDSLEAEYAKAHQLTPNIRRRFELLRAIMFRKVPGGAGTGLLKDPFFSTPPPP